jgi:RNA polymerase sigma-70 factor (ECF subfamily)
MEDNRARERSSHVRALSDSIALLRQTLPAALPRLRRFARSLTRDAQDADDLVQNAIERALRHAAQWRAPAADATAEQVEAAVRSWMFGIVKNAWIDNRRAHRRERALFANTPTGGEEDLAAIADTAHSSVQDQLSIAAAMQRLPEEQCLAVSLVLVEGLSYQEAADIMEVPIGTLTSRLSRAREALTALLGGRDSAS